MEEWNFLTFLCVFPSAPADTNRGNMREATGEELCDGDSIFPEELKIGADEHHRGL